jgi:hypothetical protein
MACPSCGDCNLLASIQALQKHVERLEDDLAALKGRALLLTVAASIASPLVGVASFCLVHFILRGSP